MQHVDGLERPHHHLEMRDAALAIEADDVDAIDLDAVDHGLEFEHGAVLTLPFADIGEAGTAKHLLGAGQIFEGDVAAALRRVHGGAFEDGVGMKEVPERSPVMRLHVAVPGLEAGHSGASLRAWAKTRKTTPCTVARRLIPLRFSGRFSPSFLDHVICTLTHMRRCA